MALQNLFSYLNLVTEPAKTNSQKEDFFSTIPADNATLIGLILGFSPAGCGCPPPGLQSCPSATGGGGAAGRFGLVPVFGAGARAAVYAPARPPDHLQGGGEDWAGLPSDKTAANKNSELAPCPRPQKSRRRPIPVALTVFASSVQNFGAGTLGIKLRNRVLEW